MQSIDYQKHITMEPGKLGGKPCIRGHRFAVRDVFDYLASGMTEQELLKEFPFLTHDDILACYAWIMDGHTVVSNSPTLADLAIIAAEFPPNPCATRDRARQQQHYLYDTPKQS